MLSVARGLATGQNPGRAHKPGQLKWQEKHHIWHDDGIVTFRISHSILSFLNLFMAFAKTGWVNLANLPMERSQDPKQIPCTACNCPTAGSKLESRVTLAKKTACFYSKVEVDLAYLLFCSEKRCQKTTQDVSRTWHSILQVESSHEQTQQPICSFSFDNYLA